MEEKGKQTDWEQLVDGIRREPVQALIIDRSMSDMVFHLLSERKTWRNITRDQMRELHDLGLLPEHIVKFLSEQSIVRPR